MLDWSTENDRQLRTLLLHVTNMTITPPAGMEEQDIIAKSLLDIRVAHCQIVTP
jgi:hypothetical protein